ncbi:MAG: hypothetical protein F6K41_05975 [Symploca sp. SIO3E6]|nr:hypothetical protein [Caldora sp. SIO3E6]
MSIPDNPLIPQASIEFYQAFADLAQAILIALYCTFLHYTAELLGYKLG